jgi:hypothetical protein
VVVSSNKASIDAPVEGRRLHKRIGTVRPLQESRARPGLRVSACDDLGWKVGRLEDAGNCVITTMPFEPARVDKLLEEIRL